MSERDEFGGYTEREAMEIMGMPVPAPTPLQSRQVIPAEAVEAAAMAVYEDTFGKSWEDESEDYRNELRETQRLALEAAAQHMLAAAWDEGYDDAIDAFDGRNVSNPYRTPDAR